MCQPMPYKIIKHHKYLNIDLSLDNNLFGFFLVEVYCPENIRPLLPFKLNNKTIYPNGRWSGVYFTEELKTLIPCGYKFKLIEGYEFNKIDLFTKYVQHFYEIKKNSSGSTKFIAKMHLNQLYGIFGRKKELINTINVYNKDLNQYLISNVIKTIIKINDDKSTLLIYKNLNNDLLKKLNIYFKTEFKSFEQEVLNNVALAAAVTSYARIHMTPFKFDENTYYTDTDSIFTSKKLDDSLINNNELGLMKDELNGLIIKEAYFLGIKEYGYYYTDENNNRVEKSTFAGIPKNSLSFQEIINIHNGETIIKHIPIRFYKSFKDLSINIKSNIEIQLNRVNNKKLVNNLYIQPQINFPLNKFSLFDLIKNKILILIKKYFNKTQ